MRRTVSRFAPASTSTNGSQSGEMAELREYHLAQTHCFRSFSLAKPTSHRRSSIRIRTTSHHILRWHGVRLTQADYFTLSSAIQDSPRFDSADPCFMTAQAEHSPSQRI